MIALTQSQKDRYERTAYVALDAVDRLVGHGLGGNASQKALDAIRELLSEIENAPLKARKARAS